MKSTTSPNKAPVNCHGGYICFFVLVLSPITVYAQQWQFEPVIKLTGQYNDNRQLTPDDSAKIDSAAFIADVNGRFVRRTQSTEFRFAPRVRSNTNEESTLESTTDIFVDVLAAKTLKKGNYGLQSRFSLEDVQTAELDDPDFDNPDVNSPVDLDSGRVRIGSERESLIFTPFFKHAWTETVEFRFDANYIDVSYDQTDQTYTDYDSLSFGTQLDFQLSDRSTWAIRFVGADYEANRGPNVSESRSIGATLEFQHQFSASMEGRVGVGYEDIDSDITSGGSTSSDSNGVTLFSAGIIKTGEISRLVLDASQSVDPGGIGFLQERTQFRLRFRRQLSPKMFGNFSARIQRTNEVSPDLIEQSDRDFRRYGVGLEWRLSQIWSLRGDYEFTSQELDGTPGSASSNKASVSFVYDPARRR